MKEKFAKLISYVFTSTAFGLFAFLLLSYFVEEPANGDIVAVISVSFGAGLPFIYILFMLHRESVTRPDVPIREQRTIPYVVYILIYLWGFLILYFMKAPVPISALMFCYATNTLVVTMINRRWKISAHAMEVHDMIDPLETREIISLGIETANNNRDIPKFNVGILQS